MADTYLAGAIEPGNFRANKVSIYLFTMHERTAIENDFLFMFELLTTLLFCYFDLRALRFPSSHSGIYFLVVSLQTSPF